MKKPIEGAAPKADIMKRIKEKAWEDALYEFSESRAFRALENTNGDEPVYNGLRRVLDAYLDYLFKQQGASEKTVSAAQRVFHDENKRDIATPERKHLVDKIQSIAYGFVGGQATGFIREAENAAREEAQAAAEIRAENERKFLLLRDAREQRFPSHLPLNDKYRQELEKVEADYAAADNNHYPAMRPKLKHTLIAFMGETSVKQHEKLEDHAADKAIDIINAYDEALDRPPLEDLVHVNKYSRRYKGQAVANYR
jgi:hypothetical protein